MLKLNRPTCQPRHSSVRRSVYLSGVSRQAPTSSVMSMLVGAALGGPLRSSNQTSAATARHNGGELRSSARNGKTSDDGRCCRGDASGECGRRTDHDDTARWRNPRGDQAVGDTECAQVLVGPQVADLRWEGR